MRDIILIDKTDKQAILMAHTDLTTEEIESVLNDKTLDEWGIGYEERLENTAISLNKNFERFYFDEVLYVDINI